MKFINEFYKCTFYVFYKLDFVIGYPWLSEMKPIVVISFVEIMAIYSIIGLIQALTGINFLLFLQTDLSIVLVVILVFLHSRQFLYRKRWKEIITEYEKMQPRQKKKNYIIMIVMIIFIVLLFTCSLFLLSSIYNT